MSRTLFGTIVSIDHIINCSNQQHIEHRYTIRAIKSRSRIKLTRSCSEFLIVKIQYERYIRSKVSNVPGNGNCTDVPNRRTHRLVTRTGFQPLSPNPYQRAILSDSTSGIFLETDSDFWLWSSEFRSQTRDPPSGTSQPLVVVYFSSRQTVFELSIASINVLLCNHARGLESSPISGNPMLIGEHD